MSRRRYNDFAQIIETEEHGPIQSPLPFVEILYRGDFIYHTVAYEQTGRLDILAYIYDEIGDPYLDWIIAEFNDIIDELTEVIPGKDLRIPLTRLNYEQDIRPFTYIGVE